MYAYGFVLESVFCVCVCIFEMVTVNGSDVDLMVNMGGLRILHLVTTGTRVWLITYIFIFSLIHCIYGNFLYVWLNCHRYTFIYTT